MPSDETNPASGAERQICPWPNPKPLVAAYAPVVPFDPNLLLPEPFVEWAASATDELQVASDLIGPPVMVAFSAAVGRRVCVRPKRNWRKVPNLWGLVVANSGCMKSPAIRRAFNFLEGLEERGHSTYLNMLERHRREIEAHRQGGVSGTPPPEPVRRRFICNDPTIEKLLVVLQENPAGILILRDEIYGFFSLLRRRDRDSERQFYLEAWSGDSPFTMDRIGRGTIYVPRTCVAMFGGIQPERHESFLRESIKGGESGDGFAQRFQIAVWPDQPATYRFVDPEPNVAAEQRVSAVFERVADLPADSQTEIALDVDGYELFKIWTEELENRLRSEKLPDIFQSHLGKYRSLMPSLALLIHLAEDGVTTDIPLHRVARAISWCEYLESHAKRIYSCVMGCPKPSVRLLGERLRSGLIGPRFSLRELYERGWAGLGTPESARSAALALVDACWLRPVESVPGSRGGRPSEIYEVNPMVLTI